MALTRLGPNQLINLASNVTGTLPAANGGTGSTSYTAGITMMDAWYQTSTQTHSSGEHTFTAWSRMSNESAKKMTNIGSAMSQTSGTFTFPATGKYFIMFKSYTDGDATTNYAGVIIKNADNQQLNSAYANRQASATSHNMAMAYTFIDIDDTTNNKCKVKFNSNQGANSTWAGGSDMQTSAIFIRIGDT